MLRMNWQDRPRNRHNSVGKATNRSLVGLVGLVLLASFMSLAFLTTVAHAKTPDLLGTYNDWKAFTTEEGGRKVCFILSTPKEKTPQNVRRGDIFFFVTSWGGTQAEPSITIGYPFKKNSTSIVKVGSDKFTLFTTDDGAWFREQKDEKRLIEAMKRGSSMTVTGTSSRGTLTSDRYSLSGITAALDKIHRTCK